MILDTNALSALFVGDRELARVLQIEARHHLVVPVLGEDRYGLRRSKQRKRLEAALETLIDESVVLPIEERTTVAHAEARHRLRELRRPIPENDVWIAALAQQHALPIVSRDLHFDRVPDVLRIGW